MTADRTAAARAARSAAATRRRHQKHAAELQAAGWTCTPPEPAHDWARPFETVTDPHGYRCIPFGPHRGDAQLVAVTIQQRTRRAMLVYSWDDPDGTHWAVRPIDPTTQETDRD